MNTVGDLKSKFIKDADGHGEKSSRWTQSWSKCVRKAVFARVNQVLPHEKCQAQIKLEAGRHERDTAQPICVSDESNNRKRIKEEAFFDSGAGWKRGS